MTNTDNTSVRAASDPSPAVLLVDDLPANLLGLQAILSDLSVSLVEAHSGEQALQRIETTEFAAILLDVHLPGIDGFETARRIRTHELASHTPILFLTAHDIDRSVLEQGYALGAVEFFVKPLSPVIVKAKVAGFVALFEEKQRARHEAEQHRLLVEGVKDYAIFMLSPEGRIKTWNLGAERIKGYRAEEIIGRHFSCFFPQEAIDRGQPDEELRRSAAEGRLEDEGWRIRKDGSQFWANVVITPLRDKDGKLRGFTKVTRDLTQWREAEEYARRLLQEEAARKAAEASTQDAQQAREQERRQREQLHVTLSSIGDAVIVTDVRGRITFMNPVAVMLTGWAPEEAAGQPLDQVFRIINEETRQPVENPAMKVLREGVIVGLANHTVLLARDGREVPIDDSGAPIRGEDGKTAGVVLVFRDVTEARKSLAAQLLLASIVESSDDAIISKDLNGIITSWNRAAERLYGYTAKEMVGQPLSILVPPDHLDELPAIVERIKRDERVEHFETVRISKDGRRVDVSLTVSPIKNEDGTITGASKIARDITARKRNEQALRTAEQQLQIVVDSMSAPVTRCSRDLRYRWVSKPYAAWLGRSPEEFPGQLIRDVLGPRAFESLRPYFDRVLAGETVRYEEQVDYRGLGRRWVSAVYTPTLDPQGKPDGWVAVVLDIDDRKRAEQELKDANRLKDEFLAMLAHELRNPLAPIRNTLQIMKLPGVDQPTLDNVREIAERQVEHMTRLLDDLLDVARISRGRIELRKTVTDVATVVTRTAEAVRSLVDERQQTLTMSLPPGALLVEGDSTRLEQVVMNLLHNAAKYTDPGGQISLIGEREDSQVVLRVRDTGIGIAPDMLPHIFDLFVQAERRLDRSRGGIGIGLTLVKKLVELHGGRIEVSSPGLGQGSEFVVRLPALASPRRVESATNAKVVDAPALPRRRVLVVDDNHDAADSLAMLLKLSRQEVRVAYDGPSALVQAKDFRPEVIMLDIGMPGMDGYEVARKLKAEPDSERIVLIAVTGWGQEEDQQRSRAAGFDAHMIKPANPQTLQEFLRHPRLHGG